jgi:hypothetical protein
VGNIEIKRKANHMISKEQTKAVLLRLPLDVKAWIEQEAARTLASQNSEIIRSIRARMDTEQRERAAG